MKRINIKRILKETNPLGKRLKDMDHNERNKIKRRRRKRGLKRRKLLERRIKCLDYVQLEIKTWCKKDGNIETEIKMKGG